MDNFPNIPKQPPKQGLPDIFPNIPAAPPIQKLPKLNIPDPFAQNSVLANLSKAAQAAYYGIAINAYKALTSFEQTITGNNYTNIPDLYNNNTPDAAPNANGGYTPTENWEGVMSSSLKGMPVLMPLTIQGGTYTALDGTEIIFPTIIFEAVICNVGMNKIVQKTDITGRSNGSVKEYIGLGDWDIEITALITSDAPVSNTNLEGGYPVSATSQEGGVYPYANMNVILQMLNAPVSLPVTSLFLNRMGITNLVVEGKVQIHRIPGEYNVQRLVIPCVSDSPLIIKIL